MNRVLRLVLNGLAILILGLAGGAAANVITIGQLEVYGPVALSGVQNALVFGASSVQFVSDFVLASWGSGTPASDYYGVTPYMSDILQLAQSVFASSGGSLFGSSGSGFGGSLLSPDLLQSLFQSAFATPAQLDTIIVLPANNPAFAVPLPSTASLMVCGFAAIAFIARVFRTRMSGAR